MGFRRTSPIAESSPIAPVNPYGESKVMVETMLRWFDAIHGLRSVCLRYFNACGADPEGGLGEEHDPETHLIPLMLRAVKSGEPFTVFGDDYDTPDGTCIRDYIHVNDLAEAHILAVEALVAGGASDQFNVGTGERAFGAGDDSRRGGSDGAEGAVRGGRAARGRSAGVGGECGQAAAECWGGSRGYAGVQEIVATAWRFEEGRGGWGLGAGAVAGGLLWWDRGHDEMVNWVLFGLQYAGTNVL